MDSSSDREIQRVNPDRLMRLKDIFNLPNFFTLGNLLCGCVAMYFVFTFRLEWSVYLVALALAADFLDGLVARALKISSPMGRELDSLADVVSFGALPGALLFHLLYQYWEKKGWDEWITLLAALPGFCFTLFAALRLAKFNLDNRQTQGFIGLATPAATIFVVGLVLMVFNNSFGLVDLIFTPWFLYGTILVLSLLMISEIPMFSFKMSGQKSIAAYKTQIIFVAIVLVLFVALKFAAVAASIIVYVLLSLFNYIKNEISRRN
ncbi:MAG: CDP-diacylglycerol--serine O-phosphatidyltransferase [Chitinophagales bacterium]|nr:CDP-diacylglycerol--serine O-phosphatidyltransferase [Chitinophagales bacterium]MDW8274364.1 CDP-diacylglycerol--serine O-phosphatidyltransferase [Chitinophagales bacterium]